MDNRKFLVWRIAIALVSGAIVAGLCLYLIASQENTYTHYPQKRTIRSFENIEVKIAAFRQKTGHLPASIAEAIPAQDLATAGWLYQDGWRRPIIYVAKGDHYALITYGADGKPGGRGMDCDFSNKNPHPAAAQLTRWDNLKNPLAQGTIGASLFCGLLVLGLTFAVVKEDDFEILLLEEVFAKLLFTLVSSILVSLVITVMHVPNGH